MVTVVLTYLFEYVMHLHVSKFKRYKRVYREKCCPLYPYHPAPFLGKTCVTSSWFVLSEILYAHAMKYANTLFHLFYVDGSLIYK